MTQVRSTSTRPSRLVCATRLALLLPLSLLLSGCPLGAGLEDAPQQDALRNKCMDTLFESNCGGGTCHGPIGYTAIDLVSPGVVNRLLDQPASYIDAFGDCPDPPQLLIDSNSPADSLLLVKVEDRQSCGDPMPPILFERNHLTEDQYSCLSEWVWSVASRETSTSGP